MFCAFPVIAAVLEYLIVILGFILLVLPLATRILAKEEVRADRRGFVLLCSLSLLTGAAIVGIYVSLAENPLPVICRVVVLGLLVSSAAVSGLYRRRS